MAHGSIDNAWHFVDGKWAAGDPKILSAWGHATWLGSSIFDGARAFEGVTPDLDRHCQRTIRSATALGLGSPLSAGEIEEILREGISKFPKGTPLYLRPFLWGQDGVMAPDPQSTKIVISVVQTEMPDPAKGASCTLSKWRRPSPETAPTDAKATSLYAHPRRPTAKPKPTRSDPALILDPMAPAATSAS